MAMHYCCSLRSELPLARPSCVAALLASLHAAANRVAPARLVRAAVTRRRWPPCSAVSRWSPHVPRRLRRLRRGDLSPCDDLADLAGAASVSRLWCRWGNQSMREREGEKAGGTHAAGDDVRWQEDGRFGASRSGHTSSAMNSEEAHGSPEKEIEAAVVFTGEGGGGPDCFFEEKLGTRLHF
ncbi:uncharacterized protein LOC119288674 [Triticum dicoccoides]|uniref:uncharacterized protein LOC119288674 n=1 Tax=Triticum dicoccoides TaxID=85692 RepID=UPI00188F2856|nr:uncharacterized protein LOC119288674 [Triticum dicoccoides]